MGFVFICNSSDSKVIFMLTVLAILKDQLQKQNSRYQSMQQPKKISLNNEIYKLNSW